MNHQAYDYETTFAVGAWLMRKARKQQAAVGTYHAARNLKKQGVPLDYALDILAPMGRAS